MAKVRRPSIDFAALKESIASQFEDLDTSDPSRWPVLPRVLSLAAVTTVVVVVLWLAWINEYATELSNAVANEQHLRADFKSKLAQAANLTFLKKQRDEVEGYVKQLESQLPSRAEMSALLSSINQLGIKRNLQFELFRPGQVVIKPYYAELPVAIRVNGTYHDFGRFASDIALLPRIATLGNISISAKTDTSMVFDATLKTYRYLDTDEAAAQRKSAAEEKK
ncbi:MAG: type 4a pilus biogenesis protein PilO [Rhodoferax sp.]